MDGIHNQSCGIYRLPHTLQLVDITRFNRIDSCFGLPQVGQRYRQIFVCLILFCHNFSFLGVTVLGDDSALIGLFLGFSVFNFKLFKKFIGVIRCLLKYDFLFLQVNLKLLYTLGGFLKFGETIDDVALFNIDSVIFLCVYLLVKINEG